MSASYINQCYRSTIPDKDQTKEESEEVGATLGADSVPHRYAAAGG